MSITALEQDDRARDLSAGPTYNDILDADTRPVPRYLREDCVPEVGVQPVPARNYTDPAFFQQEVDKMWSRVWQMACREEDIPEVGDFIVFDQAHRSYLIVRSGPNEFKALLNVCRHRGRKLATKAGNAKKFRCMFHGLEWGLDGAFAHNPIEWDFPQWRDEDMSLAEAQVARWAGFVLINFDRDAPPLDEFIHPLPEHFERYDLANMYTMVHIRKRFPANWKVVAEAFMESHHSITTHPQFMPYLGDANSKYDIYSPYVTRQFTAMGVPSPFAEGTQFTENDILHAMFGSSGRARDGSEPEISVPEGMTARAFAAELNRKALSEEDGYDYSDLSDAEMLDPLLYNLFPNLSVWAGVSLNLVYRWHPIDVDNTIMEIRILKRIPKEGPRPQTAKPRDLSADEPCTSVEEFGSLGGVFDQDMANLPYVQEGLKAGGPDFPVHFARYTEMRIRQLHMTLETYINA